MKLCYLLLRMTRPGYNVACCGVPDLLRSSFNDSSRSSIGSLSYGSSDYALHLPERLGEAHLVVEVVVKSKTDESRQRTQLGLIRVDVSSPNASAPSAPCPGTCIIWCS